MRRRKNGSPLLFTYFALALTTVPAPAWAQTNPVPFINEPLVPASVAPGSAGFTLTVNGTGFVQGSVVNWSMGGTSTPLATTFVSTSELTAAVPAGNVVTAGTASVTVSSPTPGGGTSNAVFLQIVTAESQVFLTGFDVTSVYAGDGVAVGDLNNDGKADFVVANGCCNYISVFLGNGDGTFRPVTTYTTGNGKLPLVPALGDFNGDGNLDLVVTDNASRSVTVWLGNGDGTLQAPRSFPAGNEPYSVTVADFNRDGKLDLAVSDSVRAGIAILLGNGDGTFKKPLFYSALLATAQGQTTVGDFNGDGKLDVAHASVNSDLVLVGFGKGDGTFQPPVPFRVGGPSLSVVAADFNGDGVLDLAGSTSSNTVSVLLGRGKGKFRPYTDYPTGTNPYLVLTGDFNGDGILDLATVNYDTVAGNTLSILLGNGDGTFQSHVDYQAGTAPNWGATADFNGDGRPDFVIPNISGNTISVDLQ